MSLARKFRSPEEQESWGLKFQVPALNGTYMQRKQFGVLLFRFR
jgi:hypothetical protein